MNPDWRDDAACGGKPTDWWFPESLYKAYNRTALMRHNPELREALTTCAKCPVKEECRRAGWDEPYGIFGGLLPHERRALGGGPRPHRAKQKNCSSKAPRRCVNGPRADLGMCDHCIGVEQRERELRVKEARIRELDRWGADTATIAVEVGLNRDSVRRWRRKFRAEAQGG